MARPTFKEILQDKFPEAEGLAFDRIFGDRKFFDTRSHKPLFDKKLIEAALYLAIRWAHRAGLTLHLSQDEHKLMRHFFDILPWISAGMLLLADLYDYWQ
jgi:hypothetical protein